MSLTAQQPVNNVVRTAIEALAAVLGGTNSLHTNALDETLALPTDESAEIALRTQQVLMEETGVTNVADPLGGSWYVEALTDRIEAEAEAIFDRIRDMGGDGQHPIGPMTTGILRGIEDGWFMSRSPSRLRLPAGAGEGRQARSSGSTSTPARCPGAGDPARLARGRAGAAGLLGQRRADRDNARSSASWPDGRGRRTDDNMIPAMLAAGRAEATLGEICDALPAEWGVYREPARF